MSRSAPALNYCKVPVHATKYKQSFSTCHQIQRKLKVTFYKHTKSKHFILISRHFLLQI